jgi:hypothetical protein
VSLDGRTIKGEEARRDIWVCGAGAFVLMKALAFKGRGENKDVYDLTYVLRNYGAGPVDVATQVAPLLGELEAIEAVAVLRRDFAKVESLGPMRVAEFLFDGPTRRPRPTPGARSRTCWPPFLSKSPVLSAGSGGDLSAGTSLKRDTYFGATI